MKTMANYLKAAELFSDNPKLAVSLCLDSQNIEGEDWYNELHGPHTMPYTKQTVDGSYGYLGDDGIILFLLFMHEAQQTGDVK